MPGGTLKVNEHVWHLPQILLLFVGIPNNYVEYGPRSPTNYKFEYMSKNLSLRLNQMNNIQGNF